jgi:hypothetical protein
MDSTNEDTLGTEDSACQTNDSVLSVQEVKDVQSNLKKHPQRNCTMTCIHEGKNPDPKKHKDVGHWVRCCLCTHWYHSGCMSLPKDETAGVWACPSCRNLADQVRFLQQTVNVLLELVRSNQQCVTNLMSEQRDMGNIVKELHNVMTKPVPKPENPPPPKKSLLIGDSIIKNIESKSDQLTVKANVPKLNHVIVELQEYDNLENIYIL